MQLSFTLAAALIFLTLVLRTTTADGSWFTNINGLLCIRSEFVETHAEAHSKIECGGLCGDRPLCQAFSMADGGCQLFVFSRCSKSVKNCSCTRRAPVFVRQQPGLPAGALCPAGYADDSCGTKYKVFPGITKWDTYRATVEADTGLVIMADVIDATELTYVKSVFSKYSLGLTYLGGRQLDGSPESAGGWMWFSCNLSISMGSFWASTEPNGNAYENVVALSATAAGLMDYPDGNSGTSGVSGGLGECVSPFD